MRKLFAGLISLILILSSLLFVNLNVLEDSGVLFSKYFESDQFMSEMREEMGINEFVESVPFYQKELESMFDVIEESPETKAIAKMYSQMIMVDIIKDTYSFDSDIFISYILDGFENHLIEYDNKILNTLFQLFKPFMNENVDKLDLETHYEFIVDSKKSEFTESQLKGMKMIYYFHENLDFYKKISFMIMASSFGVLMVLSYLAVLNSLSILLATNVFSSLYSAYIVKEKGYPIDNRYYLIFIMVIILFILLVRIFKHKKTA